MMTIPWLKNKSDNAGIASKALGGDKVMLVKTGELLRPLCKEFTVVETTDDDA